MGTKGNLKEITKKQVFMRENKVGVAICILVKSYWILDSHTHFTLESSYACILYTDFNIRRYIFIYK